MKEEEVNKLNEKTPIENLSNKEQDSLIKTILNLQKSKD